MVDQAAFFIGYYAKLCLSHARNYPQQRCQRPAMRGHERLKLTAIHDLRSNQSLAAYNTTPVGRELVEANGKCKAPELQSMYQMTGTGTCNATSEPAPAIPVTAGHYAVNDKTTFSPPPTTPPNVRYP
jgi:hypothetical protein